MALDNTETIVICEPQFLGFGQCSAVRRKLAWRMLRTARTFFLQFVLILAIVGAFASSVQDGSEFIIWIAIFSLVLGVLAVPKRSLTVKNGELIAEERGDIVFSFQLESIFPAFLLIESLDQNWHYLSVLTSDPTALSEHQCVFQMTVSSADARRLEQASCFTQTYSNFCFVKM